MTGREFFPQPHDPELDQKLNTTLQEFHRIADPDLYEFRNIVKKSWQDYLEAHIHSELRDAAAGKKRTPDPREEDSVSHVIQVRTGSERKWALSAPVVEKAGFVPMWDRPHDDEARIHKLIRDMDATFPRFYPSRVAQMKQPWQYGDTPILTMDTVTCIEGWPLEKPDSKEQAKGLINFVSGKSVTTDTGWNIAMNIKSGGSVSLINSHRVGYRLKFLDTQTIDTHVEQSPRVFDVPMGLDLSTVPQRKKFIDQRYAVSIVSRNHLGHEDEIVMGGHCIESPVFDAIFSGVPQHALGALLPHLPEIYLHGDPFYDAA